MKLTNSFTIDTSLQKFYREGSKKKKQQRYNRIHRWSRKDVNRHEEITDVLTQI